jgi:phosphonopyruvate decarboxylase
MLAPKDFLESLRQNGLSFFTGVPDSLLKDLCAYITDTTSQGDHIIAANEGNAIAIAAGYHIATGKVPVVYMQNSGLGNAVNPLTSLASCDVYGIPILLLIGWRAEPGIPDEPQHKQMGRIQNKLLETLEIPYSVLDSSITKTTRTIKKACLHLKANSTPYALLVPKGVFEEYKLKQNTRIEVELSREQAIETLLAFVKEDDVIVSTTRAV